MIKISKDKHELEVSKNTFESFYKRLGYEVVGAKKEAPVADKKAETKSK